MKAFLQFLAKLFAPSNKPAVKPVVPVMPPVPEPDLAIETPWMDIAKHELGVSEIYGSKHNPRILEYHDATSLSADDDETPWCSSFVSWVLRHSGCKDTNSAGARKYADYGIKLDSPKYGCIVVYKRTGGNHVHFYHHEDAHYIYGIGGNQNNEVNIKGYKKSDAISFNWPIKKLTTKQGA